MEGWVGLVGWPIADALPTNWSHVNHGSGVDQGKSASYEPTFLPLSHAANRLECRTSVKVSEGVEFNGLKKMPDMKLQDMKLTDQIAGHENTGHEFARHDKYRMKIDYITLECAFLLNFKYFVCQASVLMYKKRNCDCSS